MSADDNRWNALDTAVRTQREDDNADTIVARAETFLAFLNGDEVEVEDTPRDLGCRPVVPPRAVADNPQA